ncbi:MAG: Ribonuclease Y [Microgenomates group bacterium GW2011_GWA2_37_6]|nr:MAG: Ribonuclease Y [Microgenomates group bacterium GW2011_GWA2_37_6]
MADQDLISLEKKLIERQEKLEKEREDLDREKKQLEQKKEEYAEKLQKASGLTTDEARRELLEQIEEKETQTLAKIIKEREEEARRTADKKAQEILVDSMRHGAVNYIPEYTVSIVRIPDEEIKGRIIGKDLIKFEEK